jgi:hypothetical protein
MNLKLLIDGIVRQTTVLVAQLSTSAGVRAPLAHIANEVFLELAQEIERQGVGKKVAADMFGLALRSYQRKLQRLLESRTERDRTLWELVLERLGQGSATRRELMRRFSADGEAELGAVLKDLNEGGFIYAAGSGDSTLYGLTSAAERRGMQREEDIDALSIWIWVLVFQGEATTREALAQQLAVEADIVHAALARAVESGRVVETDGVLRASNVVLPHGATQGWESAILDHFRAVTNAIAAKVRAGRLASAADDRIGGTTVTFTVHPGHPQKDRVYGLLARARAEAEALWQEVAATNEASPPPEEGCVRVIFYVGQNVLSNQESAPS